MSYSPSLSDPPPLTNTISLDHLSENNSATAKNEFQNMHHLYPVSKGDQLCPLGFHPQVRWPTRCKRCFRDYKEHGGKRNPEDVIASTPNLSDNFGSRSNERPGGRCWTSSQNLTTSESPPRSNGDTANNQEQQQQAPVRRRRPASWTSTPDLNDDDQIMAQAGAGAGGAEATVTIPRRRHTATIVQSDNDDPTHGLRPPLPPQAKTDDVVIYKTDSLAERFRKMQLIKRQNSSEREQSFERESTASSSATHSRRSSEETQIEVNRKVDGREKSPKITITAPASPVVEKRSSVEMRVPKTVIEKVSPPVPEKRRSKSPRPRPIPESTSADVRFLMHVKSSSPKRAQQHDDMSSTCTETTDTTVVAAGTRLMDQELLEQVEALKQELDSVRQRCEKAERDKSDLMLRRLASMDTMPNKTAASEALKLQKQVNELNQLVEDLRGEKKTLSNKVQELSGRKPKAEEGELRKKLEQTQRQCEALQEENEEIKREIKNMESEMDEIQDNFREDQVDEFSHIKKDLDQTTKNCRILSFKLKKADRRIDQLELERKEMGANVDLLGKLKRMEEQLKESRDQAQRLELEKLDLMRKKTPNLATIGKSTSADGKVARGSLIRSGSQEDPGQLQMDLYASMEREADLREQLKFAQEEVSVGFKYTPLWILFYRQGHVQFNLQRKRMVMMMENQGCQTDVEDEHVLAYPRSTQTEDIPKEEEENRNSLLRLVERISLSPEPPKRPNTIFSGIRTPTYFTAAISHSLMIGTTSGNQEGEREILERRLPPPPAPRVVL